MLRFFIFINFISLFILSTSLLASDIDFEPGKEFRRTNVEPDNAIFIKYSKNLSAEAYPMGSMRKGFSIFTYDKVEANREFVGHIIFDSGTDYSNEGMIHLSEIWIKESERGKGYARFALRTLYRVLKKHAPENYKYVILNTSRRNIGMQKAADYADFCEWTSDEGAPFCPGFMLWYKIDL